MNNLKSYMDTSEESYSIKPKPDKRPDCCGLLLKINEFSINKCHQNEGENIYQEMSIFLDKQKNHFIEKLFICKTDENFFVDLLNVELLLLVVNKNLTITTSDGEDKIYDSLSTLVTLTDESPRSCYILMFHNRSLDLWLDVLKV